MNDILVVSERQWGIEAADRCYRLLLVVFEAVGSAHSLVGSRRMPNRPDIMVFPLRLGRAWLDRPLRVGRPRLIVAYRPASDGVVEIGGILHERMLLSRALRGRG